MAIGGSLDRFGRGSTSLDPATSRSARHSGLWRREERSSGIHPSAKTERELPIAIDCLLPPD